MLSLFCLLFAGDWNALLEGEWIDLTHSFSEQTLYWPTASPFKLTTEFKGETEKGYHYEANAYSASEHGGTHLDAPIHFYDDRWTSDQVPLTRTMGEAAVVDVSAKAEKNPDYQVTIADIEAHEAAHGKLPPGAILLLNTGWAKRWPDAERYLGTAQRGPEAVALLHFPGLHPDAATWLVENRDIKAVGLDTPSIDYGQSTLFESHRILFKANIPAFENVAALDRLPPRGALVIALPMKIAGGSGGPARIIARLP